MGVTFIGGFYRGAAPITPPYFSRKRNRGKSAKERFNLIRLTFTPILSATGSLVIIGFVSLWFSSDLQK